MACGVQKVGPRPQLIFMGSMESFIMKIESGRFGTLVIKDDEVITFPDGLIGFPEQHEFVLLRRTSSSPIGWLQSLTSPELALPVVSIESVSNEIPVEQLAQAVTRTKIEAELDDCAVMAVIYASSTGGQATVNLLAPIVVKVETRRGAQVIMEDTNLTTCELFTLNQHCPIRPTRIQSTSQAALTASP